MVIQYKCPNCGANMSFDVQSGMLSCDSCGRKDCIDTNQDNNSESKFNDQEAAQDVDEVLGDFEEFEDETQTRTYKENEAVQHECNNCGAILVTEPETTATSCSFCGAPMVLSDRLTGKKSPVKLIPFAITRENAINVFRKWCKKGRLTPKDFITSERLVNMTGIYVPFWLYDLNGRGEVNATCTRVRSYDKGEYIYTETSYYEVYRKVDLNYKNLPVDASEKMDDIMMDKLEPFHYNDLKEFSPPYLSGFVAENYNFNDKELFSRVEHRTRGYVEKFIRSTISGYSSVNIHNEYIDIKQRKADYTLLPVWMMCYDYKDAKHNFFMNGQTGKIVGKPPLSAQKIAAWFAGISLVSFVILKIIALMLGGSLL